MIRTPSASRAPGIIVPLVGLLLACAPPGGTSDVALQAPLVQRVDALLAPLVTSNEFSGAVLLMREGQVVYRRGFGMANHAAGVLFTPDTPADGASLAKTFTAAGIRLLVGEGRLDLDAPATRYLPEYPHPATTVRHLVSHSTGLPETYEFFDPWFGPDEVRTTAAMLRLTGLHAREPFFEPGSRYEYSNLGFDAAALVIERVTGQDYATFVRERFFEPNGMAGSFARPARLSDWPGVRTEGYAWVNGAWTSNDVLDLEGFLGASNLYFPVTDLARWGNAQVMGTALPGAVFDAGQAPLTVDGAPLPVNGLSWYCDERGVRCSYSGHHAGFHDFLHWDRERSEVVAFVSNSTIPAWRIVTLQRELVHALADSQGGRDAAVTFEPLSDLDLQSLAGIYEAPGVPPMELFVGDDRRIRLRVGGGPIVDAYPAGPEVLYSPGLDCYLAVTQDNQGSALHLRSMEMDVVARRS